MNKGEKLPNINLLIDEDKNISTNELKGKFLIIYFYPKDDTPGCTKEAIEFSSFKKEFDKLDVNLIGVSKDNIQKHKKFIEKNNINFPLASDINGTICDAFGVWIEKSMYGKKYMGIERSTFLFDKNLCLLNSWRNVKVKGHVEDVFTFLTKSIL
ncbi:MAG: peroxiredoxin [Rickettsiales bacterium]|nr:peroxiredoxin [Rickettsiales bacterium]